MTRKTAVCRPTAQMGMGGPQPRASFGDRPGAPRPRCSLLPVLGTEMLPAGVFLLQVDVLVAGILAWTQAGPQRGLSLLPQKVEQVTIATVLSDDQDRT